MRGPIQKFRGRTTGYTYQWSADTVPAVLLDTNNNPVTEGTYSGETVVWCNSQDGSVQRGTQGSPPTTDPYSTGYSPSTWEQLA